jgi:hypothetical protein
VDNPADRSAGLASVLGMNSYPALRDLAAVFGEDWPEAYDDEPMNAVDDFTARQSDSASRLPDEVAGILAGNPSEDELAELIEELDPLYDPTEQGWTYRDWLQAVAERVGQQLQAGPAVRQTDDS